MIPTIPITAIFDESGRPTRAGAEWLSLIWIASNSVTESGTTAQRPTANLWLGRVYYDTTLSKPVFVNAVSPSVVWKDAAGTTV